MYLSWANWGENIGTSVIHPVCPHLVHLCSSCPTEDPLSAAPSSHPPPGLCCTGPSKARLPRSSQHFRDRTSPPPARSPQAAGDGVSLQDEHRSRIQNRPVVTVLWRELSHAVKLGRREGEPTNEAP